MAETMESTILTHDELVVVSDILRRVKDGVDCASFTREPKFVTALAKINDAKLATYTGIVQHDYR